MFKKFLLVITLILAGAVGGTIATNVVADSPHETGCTYAHTDTAGSVICFTGPPGSSHRVVIWCRNSAGSRKSVKGPLVGIDVWSSAFCGRDSAGRQLFIYDLDDRHL